MLDFSNINPVLTFLILVGGIFSGGTGAYFIIKSQLVKVLKEELKVYKEKVIRMEQDITALQNSLQLINQEKLALVTERDYLKGLIVSAITSKKDIHKELMDEFKKASIDNTKLYRENGEK